MFGFKLYRVTGNSMLPTLRDGQLILARKVSKSRTPRIDDIVVINHPTYGRIIKRIVSQRDDAFFVAGDGDASTISSDLGPIDPQAIVSICLKK